jgi:deoxyribonuclease V
MSELNWPTTIEEATIIQQQLREQVIRHNDFGEIRTVAGVDAGYQTTDGQELARAAIVVLSYPDLQPLDYTVQYRPALFPYIPGYLSFRETPAVLAALDALKIRPDLLICDGQGIAHPRRLGIASHVGLLANIPSIGCAKSLLVGKFSDLPDERGAWVPLTHYGETIGAALRSRAGTKPLFISLGHRIDLETSLQIVMNCTTKYRLPETTRAADGLASHQRIPQIDENLQQSMFKS